MIEVTLIGHACSYITANGLRIMCDPHVFEGYGEGLFTYFPRRRVDPGGLPPPDVLFVSHRHRDHFDARSLARIDRKTPVLCPSDPEVVYVLKKLGFADLNLIGDFTELKHRGVRLLVTPSRYLVPEHGLVVATDTEAVWNMVDTIVDGELVAECRRRLGRAIDLLLWPYQPLTEVEAVENLDLAFPSRKFEAALQVLRLVAPRHVVPYSDGQFGAGCTEWLNHYRFPVSSDEVQHAARASSPAEVITAGPAQRIVVEGQRLRVEPVEESYVRAVESPPVERDWDATRPVTPFSDLPLDAWARPNRTVAELRADLGALWRDLLKSARAAPYLDAAARWGIAYDFIVEEGGGACWTARFSPPRTELVIRAGDGGDDDELAAARRGVVRVPHVVLERIMDGRLHFVTAYLGGLFRCWERFYRVGPSGLERATRYRNSHKPSPWDGDVVVSPAMFLNSLVTQSSALKQRIVDHELEEALRGSR